MSQKQQTLSWWLFYRITGVLTYPPIPLRIGLLFFYRSPPTYFIPKQKLGWVRVQVSAWFYMGWVSDLGKEQVNACPYPWDMFRVSGYYGWHSSTKKPQKALHGTHQQYAIDNDRYLILYSNISPIPSPQSPTTQVRGQMTKHLCHRTTQQTIMVSKVLVVKELADAKGITGAEVERCAHQRHP